MTQFKVGDLVRVTSYNKEGIILSISDNPLRIFPIYVLLDDKSGIGFAPGELQLLDPPIVRKFKVGDVVLYDHQTRGKVVKVNSENVKYPYEVLRNQGYSTWFREEDLEPIEFPQEQTFVVVVKTKAGINPEDILDEVMGVAWDFAEFLGDDGEVWINGEKQ